MNHKPKPLFRVGDTVRLLIRIPPHDRPDGRVAGHPAGTTLNVLEVSPAIERYRYRCRETLEINSDLTHYWVNENDLDYLLITDD